MNTENRGGLADSTTKLRAQGEIFRGLRSLSASQNVLDLKEVIKKSEIVKLELEQALRDDPENIELKSALLGVLDLNSAIRSTFIRLFLKLIITKRG
jgi:hypothetical protein